MTNPMPPAARWRVTCTGCTSVDPPDPHVLWEVGEMANAEYWAEKLVPGSQLTVERYGTTRAQGDSVASVRMVVRVQAADKSGAESTVRRLVGKAVPRVVFTGVVAEEISGAYSGAPGDPCTDPRCK